MIELGSLFRGAAARAKPIFFFRRSAERSHCFAPVMSGVDSLQRGRTLLTVLEAATFSLCCAVWLIGSSFAQTSPLSAPWQKKPFAYVEGRTWPKIENGYLVSFRRMIPNGSIPDSIHLSSLTGNQKTDLPFWLSGASKILINDVSITTTGEIIVGGLFWPTGKTEANNFIASASSSGQVISTADVGSYEPGEVCAGNDGTIWVMGQDWKAEGSGLSYNLLRNYSLNGRVLRSYLPRQGQKVEKLDLSMRREGRTPGRIILQCGTQSVGAYIGPSMTWTEIQLGDGTQQTWQIIPSSMRAILSGLALLDSHKVFASFIILGNDDETSQKGLYILNLSQGSIATWEPVNGTISPLKTKYAFQKLLGRDGASLVYLAQYRMASGDSWFLFWSTL